MASTIHFHSAAYIIFGFQLPLEKVADEHWLPMLAQVVLFGYLLDGYAKS